MPLNPHSVASRLRWSLSPYYHLAHHFIQGKHIIGEWKAPVAKLTVQSYITELQRWHDYKTNVIDYEYDYYEDALV